MAIAAFVALLSLHPVGDVITVYDSNLHRSHPFSARAVDALIFDLPFILLAALALGRAGLLPEGTRGVRRPVLGAGRYIPQTVRLQVAERDGAACVRCGARDDLHIDHVLAYSRGGSNDVDNLQVMCGRCNRAKGARN